MPVLILLARGLFPCFFFGSGALGQIKSRESVPPKSLLFIPLSSFLRLQPVRRAQPRQKVEELSSGAAAARRVAPADGDPAGSALTAAAALPSPRSGPGLREGRRPGRPTDPCPSRQRCPVITVGRGGTRAAGVTSSPLGFFLLSPVVVGVARRGGAVLVRPPRSCSRGSSEGAWRGA